jgi:hypothetical protein
MPEPPRRARFQIHLSTAIVLMFVAGGMMWANTTTHRTVRGVMPIAQDEGVTYHTIFNYNYGWPFVAIVYCDLRASYAELYYVAIIANALIAISTLTTTLFVCEWQIRRRAALKGA